MTYEDKGQISKYFTGFIMALLLPHVCGMETLDFRETSNALQFSCKEKPLHHLRKRYPETAIEEPPITTAANLPPPTTTVIPTTTPEKRPIFFFRMSMRISHDFDIGLTNETDKKYQFFVDCIESAIDRSYSNLPNYIKKSVKVTRFRSGSIIADYTIYARSSDMNFTSANTQVSAALLGAGITLASGAFAQSEKAILTTKDKFYPHQSVELTCTRPYYVTGEIKWTVNNKDPAQNSAKYTITNDGSSLVVNNASESDNGVYSCIIERMALPYIQWQNILIEPRPNIILDKTDIKLACKVQIVSLKCCADGNPVEWDPILPADTVDKSVTGCITLQHKISGTNCGSKEIFTCRLKDMRELETFDYYMSRAQVWTVTEFDCAHEILGVGKIGDTVTGLCEEGLEGHITYQCQQVNSQNGWTETQRDCVVKAIKDLERKFKVLFVEEIPVLMSILSKTAEQYTAEITQSTDTVQIIIVILIKIASISQTIIINKPVIEDFLKTVDIIVADEFKNTWAELNNHSTTENKSTELLKAIETISDRLSDDNFMFKTSSIQLNRTTIQNSFIGTSQLPNSTTQIMIPNVSKPTLITIIVFTKLDNVLPTRNTSNNDSRKSDNRINGDVVVVKVNETINNISFTFDITNTNTSLKNPQCVFWNFDVNHWDSAGCKVKLLGNEADKVTCECDHTTSFSILMSPFADKNPALAFILYIGVAISMVSLVLCLIIEKIVWKTVTVNDTSYMRHVSVVNIAVSLLIANIWFIIGASVAEPGASTPVNPCSAAVFFIHFFYLALFFWMFISALLLLYRTIMVLPQMSRAKMMLIAFTVGYCAPLLIAVITVASTSGAGRYIWTRDACWLNWSESKALLAFVIPALTIVVIVVVVVIMCKMLKREVGADPDERHTLMVIVRCVAILTPIFGITWGFGVGTIVSPDRGIYVVFAILNSLQGFFVLLFGTLLDGKVRESLSEAKLLLKNLISSPARNTNARTSTERPFALNTINVDGTSVVSATSSNSSSSSRTFINT